MPALRLSALQLAWAAAGYTRKLTSWAAAARGQDGKEFTLFLPAVSKDARPRSVRRSVADGCAAAPSTSSAASPREIGPIARGWM